MVEKYLLLQTHMNEVHDAIVTYELDPSEFQWKEVELQGDGLGLYGQSAGIVSRLVHIPTSYSCTFDMRDPFWVIIIPGRNKPREHEEVEDWEGYRSWFNAWLYWVKEQDEAPDLWAKYVGVEKLASAIDSSSQDKLSDPEQEEFKKGMEQIQTHLIELVEGSEKQQHIRNQVEYLVEAAKHQTRKDLGNIVLGTLMSTALTLGITSEQANGLFRLAGSCLYSLFSGQPLLE